MRKWRGAEERLSVGYVETEEGNNVGDGFLVAWMRGFVPEALGE